MSRPPGKDEYSVVVVQKGRFPIRWEWEIYRNRQAAPPGADIKVKPCGCSAILTPLVDDRTASAPRECQSPCLTRGMDPDEPHRAPTLPIPACVPTMIGASHRRIPELIALHVLGAACRKRYAGETPISFL